MSFGTLYTHQPNPRSTAILAIAREQGLQLDIVYADKENQENHAKLLQINPLGQVPVFVGRDGYVLTECIAIALYITSQSETTTLLGSSRRDYYNILRWMSVANADLLPAIGGVILPLLGRPQIVRMNGDDCLRAIHTDCQLLDAHLQRHRYLIGDHLSLADLFTVGAIQFGVMVFHRVLRDRYPRLLGWFFAVYDLPMFKAVAGDLHLLDLPHPTWPEQGSEEGGRGGGDSGGEVKS